MFHVAQNIFSINKSYRIIPINCIINKKIFEIISSLPSNQTFNDVFNAAENIVLGIDDGEKYNIKEVNRKVEEIADKYGFHIDPAKKVHEMSVSEKQTVEIIKVLYRGADILILDEPSAVLTPQGRKSCLTFCAVCATMERAFL